MAPKHNCYIILQLYGRRRIDLLEDPNFKIWVESPNEIMDEYWENNLREFPEKKESIDKAREILQAINAEFVFDFPKEVEVNRMLTWIHRV